MPLNVTITLSDEDLEKFQESIDRAKLVVHDEQAVARIEDAAADMINRAREIDLPNFISDRLLKLQILLNMIRDDEWSLSEEEKNSIRCVLYYFVEPNDVIPDHIPGIGFLDDALYAEIVFKELKNEIKLYQEFCQFRIAEENKRRANGLDLRVGREEDRRETSCFT